ncbi:hypothetical protein DITRI_Ditri19aG0045600 [Diplodiscus trichospermus]
MCSNNTSKSTGVRVVGNGSGVVVGDHDDYESSTLRKGKKQRIPKRGPGVAELEKILREQEKKDGVEKGNITGGICSSLVPSLANTYPPHPPHSSFTSCSNSLPRNVSFLPDHNHLSNITPSGSSQLGFGDLAGNGLSKGVYIGGSGVILPEQTLLPITWGSSETRKGEGTPKMAADFSFPILVSNGSDHNYKTFLPPMLQKNHRPCHPSVMNLFPQSAISSSSAPPSSSAGMIGAKRPRPSFPVDNWPLAPPHMRCEPSPFHPQISRLDPSSSSSNHGVFNLGTASRDPMPISPLEQQVKTYGNDHRNPSGNGTALTLGSPTTPLPSTQNCQPEIFKFMKQFPFQIFVVAYFCFVLFLFREMKENSEVLHQSSSSGSEVSVQTKSFFSFLLPPEDRQKGSASEATDLSFKSEKYIIEKTEDFIDLNLRL